MIFNIIRYILALLAYILVLSLTAIPSFLIPLRLRLKLLKPFWPFFLRTWVKFFFKIKLHRINRCPGLTAHNVGDKPFLMIANHQSFLDIPVVSSEYLVSPLMKHEIVYFPFINVTALAIGAQTVKRNSTRARKEAFDRCCKHMDKGFSLQYYPEGTRSKLDGPRPVDKIYTPLLSRAYKANIPVVPVSIYGTRNVMTANFGINAGTPVGILTHNFIYPKDFDSKEAFINACWNKVIEGYNELQASLR